MQAVDKQVTTVTSQRFIRVMAGIGMIAAALLIVVAVISGAILFAGSVGSQSATKATVTDPLTAPGLAEFRASEHQVAAPWKGDPWAAPGLAAFRASEQTITTPLTGDPFAAPSLIQFRQSEHAEAD